MNQTMKCTMNQTMKFNTVIAVAATRASQLSARMSHTRAALAAVIYISEGRNALVLDKIEAIARKVSIAARPVALVNCFKDAEYNRTGYTFAGRDAGDVARAALHVASASLQLIDLRAHAATHPRVGVVDHVSVHSLHASRRSEAADLAREIGSALGAFGVPVKLYGDAASDGVGLDEIRRRSGYFSGAAGGAWQGEFSARGGFVFDYGPAVVPEREGFAMVGAVPWVCNYNVPLVFAFGEDVDEAQRMTRAMAFGRAVAKRVSQRGGGLQSVQSMALPHGDKVEVACNLLDVEVSSTADVQRATEEVVAGIDMREFLIKSIVVEEGYVTNQTPESISAAIDAL